MERFVRKATAEDLPVLLDLIESGRMIMRKNGNPHHPHEENSPCNTTEQQHWGYATSMRYVSFSAF